MVAHATSKLKSQVQLFMLLYNFCIIVLFSNAFDVNSKYFQIYSGDILQARDFFLAKRALEFKKPVF
jgi:hypothetical protein